MKILRKIAPFAISALMTGATLAGAVAVNIADWEDTFTSSTTAVVVGSGNIGTADVSAAIAIADEVGIDTTTPSLEGESYYLEKSSNKFNLGNSATDIKTSLDDDELPVLLADGTYMDANSAEFEYTQKLTFASGLTLTHFYDSSYPGGDDPVLGFYLASSADIMNYTLDFRTNPDWDDADLEYTTIEIMGKEYYISDVTEGTSAITLLDTSSTTTIDEGTSEVLGGKTVEVTYIGNGEVKLVVDGKSTNSLSEGATYNMGGDKYLAIKDIMYVAKDTGVSKVEIAVGNGKLDIVNGEEVEINDDDVDGLYGFVSNTTTLASITLLWESYEEDFVTEDYAITLPGFDTVTFGVAGFEFPDEEELTVEGDRSTLDITVQLESGEQTISLLYLNGTDPGAYFAGIGEESGKALKTSTAGYLVMNESADDQYFIATWVSGKEHETYLFSADVSQSNDVNYTKITDVTSGDYCEDEEDEDCEFGNLVLTLDDINYAVDNKFVNITAGSGVNFYQIYTEDGLLIYAPYDNQTGIGSINISNTTGLTSYTLYMVEEDKDDTLASGDWINLTIGATATDGYVTVSAVTTDWLGSEYFELKDSDDDTYVGYAESDLGTKVLYDTGGDEDYVVITYHGSESYGKVYVSTSAAGETSWTPVEDSETSAYEAKNIIAIGGTAVNAVAREMLGLDAATPVYGNEAGWIDNTGVGEGQGILWIMDSPYTEGKYAFLIAGYEGTDTTNMKDFLTMKTLPDEEKAVIDSSLNIVEASA